MAKKAYIGVNGVARKIKKGYVGVNGVARKIKKAYIGIGGVARPCWGGGAAYFGETTPLSEAKEYILPASTEKYAMFIGGATSSSILDNSNISDAYGKSLTKQTFTGYGRSDENVSTVLGDLAIISYDRGVVCAYDESLVRTQSSEVVRSACWASIANAGSHALVAGGLTTNMDYALNTVDAIDTALTITPIAELDSYKTWAGGVSIGDYALFAGGEVRNKDSGYLGRSNSIEIYNKSLTKISPMQLNAAKSGMVTTATTDYALIIAGSTDDAFRTKSIEALSTSLTKTIAELPIVQTYLHTYAATAIGDIAFVMVESLTYVTDGFLYPDTNCNLVVTFDKSLTRETQSEKLLNRSAYAAASVGNYALFAGGSYSSDVINTVEVYTIQE